MVFPGYSSVYLFFFFLEFRKKPVRSIGNNGDLIYIVETCFLTLFSQLSDDKALQLKSNKYLVLFPLFSLLREKLICTPNMNGLFDGDPLIRSISSRNYPQLLKSTVIVCNRQFFYLRTVGGQSTRIFSRLRHNSRLKRIFLPFLNPPHLPDSRIARHRIVSVDSPIFSLRCNYLPSFIDTRHYWRARFGGSLQSRANRLKIR